jgi:hypothetical protein
LVYSSHADEIAGVIKIGRPTGSCKVAFGRVPGPEGMAISFPLHPSPSLSPLPRGERANILKLKRNSLPLEGGRARVGVNYGNFSHLRGGEGCGGNQNRVIFLEELYSGSRVIPEIPPSPPFSKGGLGGISETCFSTKYSLQNLESLHVSSRMEVGGCSR